MPEEMELNAQKKELVHKHHGKKRLNLLISICF